MEENKLEQKENKEKSIQGLMVPKHRFDYINLALKETKRNLNEQALELEKTKKELVELKNVMALIKSIAEYEDTKSVKNGHIAKN